MACRFGRPEEHVKWFACILNLECPDSRSRTEYFIYSAANKKGPQLSSEEAEEICFHGAYRRYERASRG